MYLTFIGSTMLQQLSQPLEYDDFFDLFSRTIMTMERSGYPFSQNETNFWMSSKIIQVTNLIIASLLYLTNL